MAYKNLSDMLYEKMYAELLERRNRMSSMVADGDVGKLEEAANAQINVGK